MRLFIAATLASLCCMSVRAEDWTTTDGKTYKNVTVIKHDAITVTILDEDGGASIPIEKLPPDLQQKLGYDPAKAQAAKADIAKARAQYEAAEVLKKKMQEMAKHSLTLSGIIAEPMPGGFLINVYPEQVASRPASYAGSHNGIGPSVVTDPGWNPPGNTIGVGTYFLKTKNDFHNGQAISIGVFQCGKIKDNFGADMAAYTDDLNTAVMASP